MADVFDKSKRSEVMSLIRGKGNKKTELRFIQLLRFHGIKGWRRNSLLLGKPDFVFPKLKIAVFVDGCFWHRCPFHFRMPVANQIFWETKINANRLRDRLVSRTLRKNGWIVLRIWEHDLRRLSPFCRQAVLAKLLAAIRDRQAVKSV